MIIALTAMVYFFVLMGFHHPFGEHRYRHGPLVVTGIVMVIIILQMIGIPWTVTVGVGAVVVVVLMAWLLREPDRSE